MQKEPAEKNLVNAVVDIIIITIDVPALVNAVLILKMNARIGNPQFLSCWPRLLQMPKEPAEKDLVNVVVVAKNSSRNIAVVAIQMILPLLPVDIDIQNVAVAMETDQIQLLEIDIILAVLAIVALIKLSLETGSPDLLPVRLLVNAHMATAVRKEDQ